MKPDIPILRLMEAAITHLMEGACKAEGDRVAKLIIDTTATRDIMKIRAVAAQLVAEMPGAKRLTDLWVAACERMERQR